MLLIGSAALRHYTEDMREPVDYDYICTHEEFEEQIEFFKTLGVLKAVYPLSGSSMVAKLKDGTIYEFSIAWHGSSNADILEYNDKYNYSRGYASRDVLLMIKLSHRYKKNSVHFHKTMNDIRMLREMGANVNKKKLKAILRKREEETYTYSHPSLMQNKREFFQEVDTFYKYEHDDIHVAVAVDGQPAYTKFSKDGQEVAVDKAKWKELDLRTQLLAGLEESYVLAIERSLVPHPNVLTPDQAFLKALEKVCTSITSGWFRQFCWENYDNIVSLHRETEDSLGSFYLRFKAALADGKIRKFNDNANVS
jgi:hypothetical protein